MSKIFSRSLTTLSLALAAAFAAPAAQALTIQLRDTTTGGMRADQLAAFQTAASFWESHLHDAVTVYVDINFTNQGANGILGSTQSNYDVQTYGDVRSQLWADATSSLDAQAAASLSAGPFFSFMATNLAGVESFDNNHSANNYYLGLTTANAKALGFAESTSAVNPDASIVFNGAYGGMFQYDRTGGIANNKTDFISVAEHEIGHALGFVSGVDDVDYCWGDAQFCGTGSVNGFENYAVYTPLDLFRYSAAGVRDERVGHAAYLSVDGGVTGIENFATGTNHGDGWQASHFGPGAVNLMRPYIGNGDSYDATPRDLAAFDVMGWNLSPVPEPETYALMLAGMGLIGVARRRRSV